MYEDRRTWANVKDHISPGMAPKVRHWGQPLRPNELRGSRFRGNDEEELLCGVLALFLVRL